MRVISGARLCIGVIFMESKIIISMKFIIFKYFEKRVLQKLEIYICCKFFFLDELILILFGAAIGFLLKTSIYCLVQQFFAEC